MRVRAAGSAVALVLVIGVLLAGGATGSPLAKEVPVKMALVQQRVLEGGYGPGLAIHPDGRRWVSGLPVRLGLWQDDTLLDTLDADGVQGLRFSGDGRLLLAGADIYDLDSRKREELPQPLSKTLNGAGRDYEVVTSAFSADAALLVVVASYRPPRGLSARASGVGPKGAPEQILLLEGRTRKLVQVLWQGRDVHCQALAVNERFIAAAYKDVYVWGRGDLKVRKLLKGGEAKISDLGFSPDGRYLAAVDVDGTAMLWSAQGGKRIASWRAHADRAAALAFHPRAPVLATAGGDAAIKLWALGPAPTELAASTQAGPVEGLAFGPQGERLIAAVSEPQPRLVVLEVQEVKP